MGENVSSVWIVALLGLLVLLAVLGLYLYRLRRALKEKEQEAESLREFLAFWPEQAAQIRQEREALREIRHDLRHYLLQMGEALPAEKRQRLEEIVLPPVEAGASGILQTLLRHYRQEAVAIGAEVDLKWDLDRDWGRMLPDLCLALGNLLENAVECLKREGGGWIRGRTRFMDGYVTIVLKNSCRTLLKTKNGHYLSSKASGRLGIGLQTVERIAKQYHGKADFAADGKYFQASLFLVIPEAPKETTEKAEEKTFPPANRTAEKR